MKEKDKWPPMRLTKQQYEKMSDEDKQKWIEAMEDKGKIILSEKKLDKETNEEFFKRVTGLEDAHEAKKKYFQKIAAKAGVGDTGVRDGKIDENLKKVIFGGAAYMQASTEYDGKQEALKKEQNKPEKNMKDWENIIIPGQKEANEEFEMPDGTGADAPKISKAELAKIEKEKEQANDKLREGVGNEDLTEMGREAVKEKLADTLLLETEVDNRLANYINYLEKGNKNTADQVYQQVIKTIESLPAGEIQSRLRDKVLVSDEKAKRFEKIDSDYKEAMDKFTSSTHLALKEVKAIQQEIEEFYRRVKREIVGKGSEGKSNDFRSTFETIKPEFFESTQSERVREILDWATKKASEKVPSIKNSLIFKASEIHDQIAVLGNLLKNKSVEEAKKLKEKIQSQINKLPNKEQGKKLLKKLEFVSTTYSKFSDLLLKYEVALANGTTDVAKKMEEKIKEQINKLPSGEQRKEFLKRLKETSVAALDLNGEKGEDSLEYTRISVQEMINLYREWNARENKEKKDEARKLKLKILKKINTLPLGERKKWIEKMNKNKEVKENEDSDEIREWTKEMEGKEWESYDYIVAWLDQTIPLYLARVRQGRLEEAETIKKQIQERIEKLPKDKREEQEKRLNNVYEEQEGVENEKDWDNLKWINRLKKNLENIENALTGVDFRYHLASEKILVVIDGEKKEMTREEISQQKEDLLQQKDNYDFYYNKLKDLLANYDNALKRSKRENYKNSDNNDVAQLREQIKALIEKMPEDERDDYLNRIKEEVGGKGEGETIPDPAEGSEIEGIKAEIELLKQELLAKFEEIKSAEKGNDDELIEQKNEEIKRLESKLNLLIEKITRLEVNQSGNSETNSNQTGEEGEGTGENGNENPTTTTTTAPAPESVVASTPAQATTSSTETPTAGAGEQAPNSPEQNPTEGGENGNGGDETTPASPENQPQGQESVEDSSEMTLSDRMRYQIGTAKAQLQKIENALNSDMEDDEKIEIILDGEKQILTKKEWENKKEYLESKIKIWEERIKHWENKERVRKNIDNIEKVLKENKKKGHEEKLKVVIDGKEEEKTKAEFIELLAGYKEEFGELFIKNNDAWNQEKDLEVKGFWGKMWNGFKNLSWVKQWNSLSGPRKLWWSFALGSAATTAAMALSPTFAGLGILSILGKATAVRAGTMAAALTGSAVAGKTSSFLIDADLKRLKNKKEKLSIENNWEEEKKVDEAIKALKGRKNKWNIVWGILGGMAAGMEAKSLGNSLVGVGSSTPEVKGSQAPIHEASTGASTVENNASANIGKEIERAVQHSGVIEQNESVPQNISAANETPTETPKVSSVDNPFLQSDLTPEQQEIATQYESIQQVNHGIEEIGKMGTIQIQENDWTDLDKIFEEKFPNLSKPERANLVENVLAREGVFNGKNLDMERVSEVLKEPMKGYSNLVMRAEGLSTENQRALMDKYSSLIDKIDNQDGVKIEQEHILNSPVNNDPNWGKKPSVIKEHTFGRPDIHQEVDSLKGGIDKVGDDLNSLKEELKQTTEQLKEAMQESNGDLNITAEEQEKLNILDQAAQEHNLSTGGESILEQASKVYENAATNLLTHPRETIQVDGNFKVNLTGSGNEIILTATNGSHTEIQKIKVGDFINLDDVTEVLKKFAGKFAKS